MKRGKNVRYISRDKGRVALSIADRLEDCARLLGTLATGRAGRVTGTYEKQVSSLPYTIVYAIEPHQDGTEQITILRVIHTARDWPKGAWPE